VAMVEDVPLRISEKRCEAKGEEIY